MQITKMANVCGTLARLPRMIPACRGTDRRCEAARYILHRASRGFDARFRRMSCSCLNPPSLVAWNKGTGYFTTYSHCWAEAYRKDNMILGEKRTGMYNELQIDARSAAQRKENENKGCSPCRQISVRLHLCPSAIGIVIPALDWPATPDVVPE